MENQIQVSLANICGSELEMEFQAAYQLIVSKLRQGQKGSISININFKRVENTDTMVGVDYTLTPKYPSIKKASICQVTGDGKLKTDAPAARPQVVNLFNQGGNA